MRKIKKILVGNSAERLSTTQMCSIMGSSGVQSYHYFLRCNQDTTEGFEVSDCSRATVESHCGDVSNAVCVETYY